ncbi:unnamed protein product [Blepharisma stoltei]|uniref:Cyclase n=1 Tax=Blepharisma stoltei TaxID=1481888 RepID=A0AAU9JG11_9CILI|nr:unnamed protein product [Blepharisma stoltei]
MSEPLVESISRARVVECSHVINDQIPLWPRNPSMVRCPFNTYERSGFSNEIYTLAGGTGTHIDSPAHFFEGKKTISDLQPKELVSKGVLIDVKEKCDEDNDYELTVTDIVEWENKHGRIPDRSIVCMRTGWGAKFGHPEEYKNHDESAKHPYYPGGVMRFPGFSKEAAEFLCSQRNINAIGIDTLSLDPGKLTDFAVHNAILGSEKYQIENLYLEDLPESGFTMIALPLLIDHAPELAARVIAILDYN